MIAVYPTAPEVPRNLLRLHFQFPEAMAEGTSRRVRVERAATGDVLTDALLPLDPELWDGTHRRLTVLFDPARLKRGLVPHDEAGYPLTAGVDVRVVIGEHAVTYRVGPDLRTRVDPHRWRIEAPQVGSRDPVVVEFDRSLDFALLGACVRITGVSGVAAIGEREASWAFFPDEPWSDETVTLEVDGRLEDVAGNSVTRVFDRDLTLAADDPLQVDTVAIPILLRPL